MIDKLFFFFKKKKNVLWQMNSTSQKEGISGSSDLKSLAINVAGWSRVFSAGAAKEFTSSIKQ